VDGLPARMVALFVVVKANPDRAVATALMIGKNGDSKIFKSRFDCYKI